MICSVVVWLGSVLTFDRFYDLDMTVQLILFHFWSWNSEN